MCSLVGRFQTWLLQKESVLSFFFCKSNRTKGTPCLILSSLYFPGSVPVLNGTSGELSPGCSTCSILTTHCSTNTHLILVFLFCPQPPYRCPLLSFLLYLFISRSFDCPCTDDLYSCWCELLLPVLSEVLLRWLLDLRNVSPQLPLTNLICHINNPIDSPVSHCCFNRAALCAAYQHSSHGCFPGVLSCQGLPQAGSFGVSRSTNPRRQH